MANATPAPNTNLSTDALLKKYGMSMQEFLGVFVQGHMNGLIDHNSKAMGGKDLTAYKREYTQIGERIYALAADKNKSQGNIAYEDRKPLNTLDLAAYGSLTERQAGLLYRAILAAQMNLGVLIEGYAEREKVRIAKATAVGNVEGMKEEAYLVRFRDYKAVLDILAKELRFFETSCTDPAIMCPAEPVAVTDIARNYSMK